MLNGSAAPVIKTITSIKKTTSASNFQARKSSIKNKNIFIVDLFLEDTTIPFRETVLGLNILHQNLDVKFMDSDRAIDDNFFIKFDSTGTGGTVKFFYDQIINLSDGEFRGHFRMSRDNMQGSIDVISARLTNEEKKEMKVPLEKKIYVAIWTLANKDSYREIENLFGLEKSTVCLIFHSICTIIANLRFEYTKWPTRQQQQLTRQTVLGQHGFPNCVGFVDGYHIQILGPARNPVDFYNRTEVNSIILQANCNERLEFTNIHLGHTGRAHDARIFRESQVNEELRNLVSSENHILGDSYTLGLRLLTPFRDNGHLTNSERKYNKTHASSRAYIERAFGRLKGTFRRLKSLEIRKTENSTILHTAACVLHNFILLHEPLELPMDFPPVDNGINLQNLITGREKRELICNFINRQ